jgi:release factor glutamine methyltransferase
VGEREFFSRPFKVSPDVLIPRPETEELVERALAFLGNRSNENLLTRVLDIGTGSGIIAITLALENPILEITASDISEQALDIARHNAAFLKASNVQFVHSNVFSAFESNRTTHSITHSATDSGTQRSSSGPTWQFDLILSNPPYIRSGDEHLSQGDLRFEPAMALTDHADGLSFYRTIAQESPQYLRPQGAIMVEHGYDQQPQIIEIFKQAGYTQVQGLNDLAGTPRIVVASR